MGMWHSVDTCIRLGSKMAHPHAEEHDWGAIASPWPTNRLGKNIYIMNVTHCETPEMRMFYSNNHNWTFNWRMQNVVGSSIFLPSPLVSRGFPINNEPTRGHTGFGKSINNINVEVILASHCHHVPQVGIPHIEPEIKARKVTLAPISDTDLTTYAANFTFHIKKIKLATAIIIYKLWAAKDAGTCMYIIL